MTNLKNISTNISSELILELISYIDLTSLKKEDSKVTIQKLITSANQGYLNHYPAAVCVFSKFGKQVSDHLTHNIKTAVVCSNFPHGQSPNNVETFELRELNNSKIDEIDIINRAQTDETKKIITLLHNKTVKTILETGHLNDIEIKASAESAIKAGSHFIKTSTGTTTGYTPNALKIMCTVIKNHFETTGIKVGIKPSGGIRSLNQAIEIHTVITNVLGKTWLTPRLFRIGASSLYTNLINEHKTRFT